MPTLTKEQMREKRDKKLRAAMMDRVPLWLENDEYRPNEDSLLFNLIYANEVDGWISERFKYDGFNDVLYHMGERLLTEEETLKYQEKEPYLSGEVATYVPLNPSQRLSPPLPKL